MPDVSIPLIFEQSRFVFGSEVLAENGDGNLHLIVPFLPWFRMPTGEHLNQLVSAVNELITRLNLVSQQRVITAAGNVTVALGDYQILMNNGGAANITLPNITDWVDGGYNFAPIWIKDYANSAGTNALDVLTPDGATIDKYSHWPIQADGAGAKFRALNDKTGWVVAG